MKVKNTPVIELRKLTKSYGLGDAMHNALDEVDLVIEKGEFITIMGPSGCGKTTLLNILGLLDRTNEGEYLLDGMSVEHLSNSRHARIRSSRSTAGCPSPRPTAPPATSNRTTDSRRRRNQRRCRSRLD